MRIRFVDQRAGKRRVYQKLVEGFKGVGSRGIGVPACPVWISILRRQDTVQGDWPLFNPRSKDNIDGSEKRHAAYWTDLGYTWLP